MKDLVGTVSETLFFWLMTVFCSFCVYMVVLDVKSSHARDQASQEAWGDPAPGLTHSEWAQLCVEQSLREESK